jgi:hypothetical protein
MVHAQSQVADTTLTRSLILGLQRICSSSIDSSLQQRQTFILISTLANNAGRTQTHSG